MFESVGMCKEACEAYLKVVEMNISLDFRIIKIFINSIF